MQCVHENGPITQASSIKQTHSVSNDIDTAKPDLCTPCTYPTTHIPNLQRYTKGQYAEALQLMDRIKNLWIKAWFGIYQVQDEDEVTHATKIRKLYASAGMGGLLRQPGHRDANIYFRGYWETVGMGKLSEVLVEYGPTESWPVIGRLKIYDGMALDTMQHVSLLLQEYEKQVDKLSELYQFLEGLQIPDPYYHGQPTDEHVILVMRGFRERAGGIVMALTKLDLQMGAVQRSIKKEALMLHGRLDGVEMLHLKKVLKP